MSKFFICEHQTCTEDAHLILVYGCLNDHLEDSLLCNLHYLSWSRQSPKAVCGKCFYKIEEHEIRLTQRITMQAATKVLNRPVQQQKTKNRLRSLPTAWGVTTPPIKPPRNP
jgi:hypothetical protein